LGRNTFKAAKADTPIAVGQYPFTSPAELETWLDLLVKKQAKKRK
jgi:hypothetical protein